MAACDMPLLPICRHLQRLLVPRAIRMERVLANVIKHPRAMTIAGSDSGAGAGIQADLKTFSALGVYGTSVVTAVTAQNTVEVAAIAEVPEEVVIAQIDTVAEDIGADAVKTGMLVSGSIIQNVADRLEAWGIPHLIVDPVMVAKSGVSLLREDAVAALIAELIPRATIITPNILEAQVLSGRAIATVSDMREAARAIHALGPEILVITGGALPGAPIDVVFDGTEMLELAGERVDTPNIHGTGCTFSAAITALLARDVAKLDAIRLAKVYVEATLAASVAIGNGRGPVNHSAALPAELRDRLSGAGVEPGS